MCIRDRKKVLYTLFVQLGQIQFCNIEAFLVSAKKQKELKRIPVRTDGICLLYTSHDDAHD